MAMESKKPVSKVKTAVWSCVGFLVAWAATKALDTYMNTTLLHDALSLLSHVWGWLLLDTPMPNWSLVGIIVTLAGTLYVVFHLYRLLNGAYDDLFEAEQAALASKKPSQPPLSEIQVKILWCFAHFTNTGESFQGGAVALYTKLGRLEMETGMDQLVAMGLVEWTVYNPVTEVLTPRLTLKGKERALAIYADLPPLTMHPIPPKPSISDLKCPVG